MQKQIILPTYTAKDGSDVEVEQYVWMAHYNDGERLYQFDNETMQFHNFAEIDQSRLNTFRMYRYDNDRYFFDLKFDPQTMKLIHFYRNVRLDVGRTDTFIRLYCFGYEKEKDVVIHAIMPSDDGIGIITTDKKEFALNLQV